jgi:hypothetical protein
MYNLHKAHVNLQCLTEVFLKREMLQTKVAEKSKTHTLYSTNCFRKSCRLRDNVENYGRARQATWQYNTAHALCVLH